MEGLSFPHHEEQSDDVALQKHHAIPDTAAAIHALIVETCDVYKESKMMSWCDDIIEI